MDVTYVSALSALAGSVVGGLTSTGMTRLTQRAQTRSGQRAHEFTRREDLYRDFIVAASKTYGDALVSSEPKLPPIVTALMGGTAPRVATVTGIAGLLQAFPAPASEANGLEWCSMPPAARCQCWTS